MTAYDIFISYETTTGLQIARHLKQALKKLGRTAFVADEDLTVGSDWEKAISHEIGECKDFVLVLTNLAFKSDQVLREVKCAVELNRRIITCKRSNVDEKAIDITFPALSHLQRIDFRDEYELADKVIGALLEKEIDLVQSQLNIKPEGATYWLDGIPQSDDQELKERTLKALLYALDDKYPAAVEEFENMLRVCTPSPTERMSILLNLGNAYYSLSRYDDALRNYRAILDLMQKVSEKSALEGESAALGNIGLIFRAKGELDTALKYLEDALEILDRLNLVYGRDIIQKAIDSITKEKT